MSISIETLALAKSFTKKQLAQAIEDLAGAGGITYEIVSSLPSTGEPGKIYLVPRAEPEESDMYDEYLWLQNAWKRIPWRTTDLSLYVRRSDLETKLLEYYKLKPSDTGKGLSTNDYTNEEKEALRAKPYIDLGIQTAGIGEALVVKTIDQHGKPTSWDTDAVKRTLIVTALTQDDVTVTGQTVTVRSVDKDGPIFASASYEGQPVSFALPVGFEYYVSISDTLAHHFNPTTAYGIVSTTDIAVTLTYSDFSSISTARDIQAALDSGIDLTDLVGEQITCSKGNTTLVWDVADYDETTEEVTLMTYDTLPDQMVFELPQALAYFEDGLLAGDYKFKNGNVYYYFTLTVDIPAAGQLKATISAFQTYASQASTIQLESGVVSTTEIVNAIDLGVCGSDSGTYALNHMDRVNYGSNNFGESGIRQWLNSDAEANTPMPRLTKFSRPYSVNQPGFLKDLDSDFLDVIVETDWLVASNSTYECPASLGGITTTRNVYTVRAKFAFASEKEVFGTFTNLDAGEHIFDLYKNATATDSIKRYNNQARYWWLRTPYTNADYERYTLTNGVVYNANAHYSSGVVPVCKIKKSNSSAPVGAP